MNRTTLIGTPFLAATLVFGLAGCTTPTPTPDPAAPTASPAPTGQAATPAGTGGMLDFATVQRLTTPAFESDPNCAAGEWSENSTGIDEEFRPAATTIQQYDCYLSADDVGTTLPERIQQSIYVEFRDPDSARAYAEDESVLYSVLIDRTRVVVAGSGLETVDMPAYLDQVRTECDCGEILGG